ncbi:hypothetical protein Y032_0067g112 [Ancylostoma ceylanicum]|uniref:Uncharacterized protein n=1 Tax=Ancylostoma ceylanicum TaxID=53326 RepID=A0A016TYH6_9BILA|nr:hypothetical protein Y032_0067g112 [Ancylostoma ceylanicum]
MKLAIALSIAIVSVAIAKPTPRNDSESREEVTSITPNYHAYHRRHTAPPITTVDITVGAKSCSIADSLSISPLSRTIATHIIVVTLALQQPPLRRAPAF